MSRRKTDWAKKYLHTDTIEEETEEKDRFDTINEEEELDTKALQEKFSMDEDLDNVDQYKDKARRCL
jgi:hypothetical protein